MKMTKENKEVVREQYANVWHEDQKMTDYCTNKASGYIDFGDAMVIFDKPGIQTDFWFGEHTYDYDEVASHCEKMSESEQYFVRENLGRCDAYVMLEALEGRDRHGYSASFTPYLVRSKYWSQDDDCTIGYVNVLRYGASPEEHFRTSRGPQDYRELDSEEVDALKAFLREEVEKFQKRLNTYLKRYGLSKCHYGVYWADR